LTRPPARALQKAQKQKKFSIAKTWWNDDHNDDDDFLETASGICVFCLPIEWQNKTRLSFFVFQFIVVLFIVLFVFLFMCFA